MKFRDRCTFGCSGDRPTIKVGELGYSVAAVDRG